MKNNKINTVYRPVCRVGAGLIAVLACTSAAAEMRTTALEEVVVSAQKREESLQAAPLAVSAFSAETLEQLNIYTPTDIARFTPNMLAEPQPGASGTTNYSLRGITQTEPSLSVDPGVGVYLNGIYIARNNSLVLDFADLERIEVLRGPQGTLYGRNSSGGAINIITAKPRGELGFKQRLSVGNYGRQRSISTLDTPSWNGLSAKLSYMKNRSDGYIRNVTTSFQQGHADDFGAVDQDAAYLALNWSGDSVGVDYQFDWSDSSNIPPAFQVTHVDVDRARRFVDGLFGAGFFNSAGGAAIRGTYEKGAALASTSRRAHSLNMPYAGEEDARISGHGLMLSWNPTSALTLKSITGYRRMRLDHRTDMSGGSSVQGADGRWIALFAGGTPSEKRNEQFSQELQLVGSFDRADMVAGLYYFDENGYASGRSQVSVSRGNWGRPNTSKIDNSAWAVFGQVTYRPIEALGLTAGLRYTEDKRALEDISYDAAAAGYLARRFHQDFRNTSGTLTADYAWTDTLSTYFRVATGYKAGGFLDRTAVAVQRPFDEETLISYELGLKSEWFERRLRINSALFYSRYDDLQMTQFVPSAGGDQSIISNAGRASYRGFEAELVAVPIPGLTATLSYGYLDPEYDEYEFFDPTGQFCGTALTTCDVADRAHFPTAPRNTAAASLQYQFEPFRIGTLTAHIDATYNDGYQHGTIDSASDRFVEAKPHTLVNARLALSDIALWGDSRLELALWGKNLSDTTYLVYGIGAFDNLGFAGGVFNTPRTYGLDLTVQF